jgi:hypothetical protein
MCVSSDAIIIPILHLFIQIGTAAMRLKGVINIYLTVLVLNFILSHIVVYVHTANSVHFNEIFKAFIFIQLMYNYDCSKRMLKFTLKCSYMFRFNNHHQGATIRTLLKL